MPEQTISDQPAREASRGRRAIVPIVVIVLLAAAGVFIWRTVAGKSRSPDNVISLSGRIEGDESSVSSKTTGRLLEIKVREGDQVKAGQVIATLDDEQVRAREAQAAAGLAQSEARLRASRQQIAILNDQLRQNSVEGAQSRQDAQGRVSQAEADVAAAQAELAQQEASLKLALFDREAYTRLAKTGAVSERQGKQAETAADTQQASVSAAQRRVEAARAAVTAAGATLKNPEIRGIQASGIRQQIVQQQAEIASAAADAQRARAQLAEAEANRGDLTIQAPFEGTVVTRTAEPGEVLMAGTPIITLLDLRKVYLRGYVPEGEISKVKINQPARVYLDSSPREPLEAAVLRIDPQATFTPENTYFRDDRVKQVVGVKLGLKSGFGAAKPGMPADGEILVNGNTWPTGTRRK
jgi:HlyD family secretion protein